MAYQNMFLNILSKSSPPTYDFIPMTGVHLYFTNVANEATFYHNSLTSPTYDLDIPRIFTKLYNLNPDVVLLPSIKAASDFYRDFIATNETCVEDILDSSSE